MQKLGACGRATTKVRSGASHTLKSKHGDTAEI